MLLIQLRNKGQFLGKVQYIFSNTTNSCWFGFTYLREMVFFDREAHDSKMATVNTGNIGNESLGKERNFRDYLHSP